MRIDQQSLFPIDESVVRQSIDSHNLVWLLTNHQVSEDTLREVLGDFNQHLWTIISEYQLMSEEFLKEYWDQLDWDLISYHQKLTLDIVKEHYLEVSWRHMLTSPYLSIDVVNAFPSKINWHLISIMGYPDIVFDEHMDKLNLREVLKNKNTSEELIGRVSNMLAFADSF